MQTAHLQLQSSPTSNRAGPGQVGPAGRSPTAVDLSSIGVWAYNAEEGGGGRKGVRGGGWAGFGV